MAAGADEKSHNTQIIIAGIGLIGVLGTAYISNIEKIRPVAPTTAPGQNGQELNEPSGTAPAHEPPVAPAAEAVPLALSDFTTRVLRFYEGSVDTPPVDDRLFMDAFPRSTTRYIYFQLDLTHEARTERSEFTLDVHFEQEGVGDFGSFVKPSYLEPDWTSSWHTERFGWDDPGRWPVGVFWVTVSMNGETLARRAFQIYQD